VLKSTDRISAVIRALTALVFVIAAAGCSALPFGGEPEGPPPLTPALQNKLDRLMHQVRYSRGPTLLKQLREISAFGRYATAPVRDQLLASDEARLRAGAVFVLGEIDRLDGDEAARDAVRSALADPDRTVRLEAGRALLEAGVKDGAVELIAALEDPQRGVRMRAFLALAHAAGERFGYDVDASTDQRRVAAERFRDHFETRAVLPVAVSDFGMADATAERSERIENVGATDAEEVYGPELPPSWALPPADAPAATPDDESATEG
jgi:HEAT repeat protein